MSDPKEVAERGVEAYLRATRPEPEAPIMTDEMVDIFMDRLGSGAFSTADIRMAWEAALRIAPRVWR